MKLRTKSGDAVSYHLRGEDLEHGYRTVELNVVEQICEDGGLDGCADSEISVVLLRAAMISIATATFDAVEDMMTMHLDS